MTTSTTTTSHKKTFIKYFRLFAAAAFWFAVWSVCAARVGQELILPTPASVLRELASMCTEAGFWYAAAVSLLRIFAGFAAGVIVGTALAPLTYFFVTADTVFSPVIRIVRATPVASFIILALLWIGKANVPAFIAMLMVIPIVWENTRTGIENTDAQLLEMASVYRFGFWKTVRLVYIPSVRPQWNAACITSLGLAWKAGIAAEVLCLPESALGTQLYYSKIYLETPSLFAWTAVVIILSFLVEKVFVKLMKRGVGR